MLAVVGRKWEDKGKSEVAEYYDHCVGIPVLMVAMKSIEVIEERR
jgi:hypothetical protein